MATSSTRTSQTKNLDTSKLRRSLENVSQKHFNDHPLPKIMWAIPQGVIYDNMDITSYVAPSCYYPETDSIVIHPYLHARNAPMYVINYLVFHELLHSIHQGDPDDPHPEEFKAQEKTAPHRDKAKGWLEENGFPVMNW